MWRRFRMLVFSVNRVCRGNSRPRDSTRTYVEFAMKTSWSDRRKQRRRRRVSTLINSPNTSARRYDNLTKSLAYDHIPSMPACANLDGLTCPVFRDLLLIIIYCCPPGFCKIQQYVELYHRRTCGLNEHHSLKNAAQP